MLKIIHAPVFIKQFNKLDKDLQIEVSEKVESFRNEDNHRILNVHKLHGKFKEKYSFYVNYKIRVVFMWVSKNEVALLVVGDHDLYK